MIVIDPFDIAVGGCFLVVLDEKYFALILVVVKIMLSMIRLYVKQL